jgi:hypothetical protein
MADEPKGQAAGGTAHQTLVAFVDAGAQPSDVSNGGSDIWDVDVEVHSAWTGVQPPRAEEAAVLR